MNVCIIIGVCAVRMLIGPAPRSIISLRENVDIYVTGSNSKFLSSDVLTEFRGRGDEVRIYPLSFSEYVSACPGDKYEAWDDYYTYGGLPMILSRSADELKSRYLQNLCKELYLKDIEGRYNLHSDNVMPALLNILASSVGSLSNPSKLVNTFASNGIKATDKTILHHHSNTILLTSGFATHS